MDNNLIYQTLVDGLRERFGFDFCALALEEDSLSQYAIKWRVASGNLNGRYRRIVLKKGRGVAGTVFKTGKPILVQSIDPDRHAIGLFDYPIVASERLTSCGAVPLWNGGRISGVLLGGFRDGRAEVTEDQIRELLYVLPEGLPGFDGKELTRL
ncbi:GAF domain-containing protein [Bhargavaea cecembensis]|uniref:GAF domain-containing protein n=1 Tax=Bhargavaea cecembensis TaxID=394098 RepID=UPI00058C71E3|nr:GAF domain-containing protein [Bhargavaea cecembensis]